MQNPFKSLWDWFSWGKSLEGTVELDRLELSKKSDDERKQILSAFLQYITAKGFQVTFQSEFAATLSKRKRIPIFAFIIVNFLMLLLIGFFWLPFMLIWTVVFISRVVNPRHRISKVTVDEYGELRKE